jgi:hypothetical protein
VEGGIAKKIVKEEPHLKCNTPHSIGKHFKEDEIWRCLECGIRYQWTFLSKEQYGWEVYFEDASRLTRMHRGETLADLPSYNGTTKVI